MFIIIATEGGLIDRVAIRTTEDEALPLMDEMAKGKDHETDNVRVFHFKLPVRYLELHGEAQEFRSADF